MKNSELKLRKLWAHGENFAYGAVYTSEEGFEEILVSYEVFKNEKSGEFELHHTSGNGFQKGYAKSESREGMERVVKTLVDSLMTECALNPEILEALRA